MTNVSRDPKFYRPQGAPVPRSKHAAFRGWLVLPLTWVTVCGLLAGAAIAVGLIRVFEWWAAGGWR